MRFVGPTGQCRIYSVPLNPELVFGRFSKFFFLGRLGQFFESPASLSVVCQKCDEIKCLAEAFFNYYYDRKYHLGLHLISLELPSWFSEVETKLYLNFNSS